ncbi:MAG: hypothetical protein QOD45_192 [Pseudonocardiales bacterium]|nr:hypothetical protein [Pseudonocardiales bacterium]
MRSGLRRHVVCSGSHDMTAEPPPDAPKPPDEDAWAAAASQFLVGQLASVQKTASTWATTITTLFGLFGTVAVIAGPNDITKLPTGLRVVTIIITVIAAGLAAYSIWQSSKAQANPDEVITNFNPDSYQGWVLASVKTAKAELAKAKIAGVCAAILLFAIGMIALIAAAAGATTA